MIFPYFEIFENETAFLVENLLVKPFDIEFNPIYDWHYLVCNLKFNFASNFIPNDTTCILINLINQLEDISVSNHLENITTIYHYSIPNTKLFYPEPFIASASFMHSDLWFVHILIYQYWLWFVFIFLIVFFFLTFMSVIRWCNMRVKPCRETRGVSRSKCGDLITACVPVSWATSIIVNESTDAIDFFDGFGTTELVIGIRAYQWGWEYYYPKDIDLNYNIKKNYSAYIGNSLKYSSTSSVNTKINSLWKFYQNKTSDAIITPAHLLFLSNDANKILNFITFNDIGTSPLIESAAFKRTKMFFKFNNVNLFYNLNSFNDKYKNFSKLYINDLNTYNSFFYGFKRQHNFLIQSNCVKNTFLNYKNITKLLKYNFNNNLNSYQFFFNNNSNFFNKITNTNLDVYNTYFAKYFIKNKTFSIKLFFNIFQTYERLSSTFNYRNKEKIKYPMRKLMLFLNNGDENFLLNNYNLFNTLNKIHNFAYMSNNNFDNVFKIYKNNLPFSSNKSKALIDKRLRSYLSIKPNKNHKNLSNDMNIFNNYQNFSNKNIFLNLNTYYNLSKTNWIELDVFYKLASNKVMGNYPFYPIISNNPFQSFSDYDSLKHPLSVDKVPMAFKHKEEQIPASFLSLYWNFFFLNTSTNWKIQNNLKYFFLANNFYLPIFNFYYDYDFRNWQSIGLLEDVIWDTNYSDTIYEEYFELFNNFYQNTYIDNELNLYYLENKNYEIETLLFDTSVYENNDSYLNFYSNCFFVDDFHINLNLLNTHNFNIFNVINYINGLDDTYENFKFLNYLYNSYHKLFINSNLNYFKSHSYTAVFDHFKSNYEELSWFRDVNNKLLDYHTYSNLWSLYDNSEILKFFESLYPSYRWVKFLCDYGIMCRYNYVSEECLNNPNTAKLFLGDLEDLSTLGSDFKLNKLFSTNRVNNNLTLRSTVKGSIVNYNALQKVFKARFDDSRSNTKMLEFGNFYLKQPYLNSNRISYETLLGKNKHNFFKINLYKSNLYKNFNTYYNIYTFANYSFFDFPFLLGMKSDASKHFWIDWFTKWSYVEIQPASTSKYAIHGMYYFNRFFDFNLKGVGLINETENYFTRIGRARKNYIPNWTYVPYFTLKNKQWFRDTLFFENLYELDNTLILAKLNLNLIENYWTQIVYHDNNNYLFIPSISNLNSYGKSTWRPFKSVSAYYYNTANLIDILTKREYLYRQLLSNNNKIINLPVELTNSPKNQLLKDLKSSFFFVDTIVANAEFSREIYYNSLEFFNFNILKAYLKSINVLSTDRLIEDLFFFFFNPNTKANNNNNFELYKNQYRPLKKGVNNMLRLHASGAIAMPIEIRLQILASSKDVIHSWAVPSAGVKIDCVPGYSSHKVIIFLVSGIFWGQCMEICGRYHHWMPIVVYFMKRDLFFLWCTHFVFLSNSNNIWNMNDRQYLNYAKVASHDPMSWLNELI